MSNVLSEYVWREDECYSWKIESFHEEEGFNTYTASLKSQKWKGYLWSHRISIMVPKKVEHNHILLLITGSGSGLEEFVYCKAFSHMLPLPCVILHDVPNQPLFNGLYEDALVSYTFHKFLETEDEEWPLLLPMVKSAKKAMDMVEVFMEGELGALNGFIVTGASKRGWTTWLLAAADKRVSGIIPLVFDCLNLNEQMKHQLECYGGYSELIKDYTRLRLQEHMYSEVGQRLVQIIDPFNYLEYLTVPKLIVNGTNDRFWTVDAANLYFDALLGEKYLLYVPNSGHALEDMRRVINSVSAFAQSIVSNKSLPKLRVEKDENGCITFRLSSSEKPLYVDGWLASSKSMDFRGSAWSSLPLLKHGDNFVHHIEKRKEYVAFFGESSFLHSDKYVFSLSTRMNIIPPVA
ncbi:MAG: PhoPQ-activated pathogenicity-related family protein [Crenarchaeota archaeon]|nr:PhoPQ-activated pathogenicity-related family protein [Thermoproteota archaeon]